MVHKSGGHSTLWPSDGPQHEATVAGEVCGSVVTGGTLGELVLWRQQEGGVHMVLSGHQAKIRCLCEVRRGETFASGCDIGEVRLWSGVSGRCLGAYGGLDAPVRDVAGMEAGEVIVSSGRRTLAILANEAGGLAVKKRLFVGSSCPPLGALRMVSGKLWAAPAFSRARCWLDPLHPAHEPPLVESDEREGSEGGDADMEHFKDGIADGANGLCVDEAQEPSVCVSPSGVSCTVDAHGAWEAISSDGRSLASGSDVAAAAFDDKGILALLMRNGALDIRQEGRYNARCSWSHQPSAGVGKPFAVFVASDGFWRAQKRPSCLLGPAAAPELWLPEAKPKPAVHLLGGLGYIRAIGKGHVEARLLRRRASGNGVPRTRLHSGEVLCIAALEANVLVTGDDGGRIVASKVGASGELVQEEEFLVHNNPISVVVTERSTRASIPAVALCCCHDGSASVLHRWSDGTWGTPLVLPNSGFSGKPGEASLSPSLGFACARKGRTGPVTVWDVEAGSVDRVVPPGREGNALLARGAQHGYDTGVGQLVVGCDPSGHVKGSGDAEMWHCGEVLRLAMAHPWGLSQQADSTMGSILESVGFTGDNWLSEAGVAISGANGALSMAVGPGATYPLKRSERVVAERALAGITLGHRALEQGIGDVSALHELKSFHAVEMARCPSGIKKPSLPYLASFFNTLPEDVSVSAWTLFECSVREGAQPEPCEWDSDELCSSGGDLGHDSYWLAAAGRCLVLDQTDGMEREAAKNLVQMAWHLPRKSAIQACGLLSEQVAMWRRALGHELAVGCFQAAAASMKPTDNDEGIKEVPKPASDPHEAIVILLTAICSESPPEFLIELEKSVQSAGAGSEDVPRALEALGRASSSRPSSLMAHLLDAVDVLLLAVNPGSASLRRAWRDTALSVVDEMARSMPCVNLNRKCMRLAVASPERRHPVASVFDARHGSHVRDLEAPQGSLGDVDAIGVDDSGLRVAAYSRETSQLVVWQLPSPLQDALSLRGGPTRAKYTTPVPPQQPLMEPGGEVSSAMDPRFEVEWLGSSSVAITRNGRHLIVCRGI